MNRAAWSRRNLLCVSASAVGWMLVSRSANADPKDADLAIKALFGDRPVNDGRVSVELPPISENGYSVPFVVSVESPMTERDHVVRIAVLSEKNPIADVARFELGPRAGVARIETRIRLGGSQRVCAVAEMSDGSLWTGFAFTIVTLAACVI